MAKQDDLKPPLDSEGRYRLLVDAVTDYAIYMLDPEGCVVSWNSGAQRVKGYGEEEILGQHFSRFYTPEDRRAGLPDRTLRASAREGRFEAEGWRVRKDGRRFWAHVVVDPILAPDRSLLGFAKVTRDLTERRAAEESLRRSEEQFRLLVEGVTDYAIYMLSPDGVVTNWNAGAQRIKGYLPAEVIGTTSPASIAKTTVQRVGPPPPWRRRQSKAGSKARAGGFARTERSSGPTRSSTPSATPTDISSDSPRSRAT